MTSAGWQGVTALVNPLGVRLMKLKDFLGHLGLDFLDDIGRGEELLKSHHGH